MFLKAIPADRGHFIITESEVWYQPPDSVSPSAVKKWFKQDLKILEVHLRRWLSSDLHYLATINPADVEILHHTVKKHKAVMMPGVTKPLPVVRPKTPRGPVPRHTPKPIVRPASHELDLANLILKLPLESIPRFFGGLGVRTVELSEQIPADLRMTEKACKIIRKIHPNWPLTLEGTP